MDYTKLNKFRAILSAFAEAVDQIRLVPRIIIICYGYVMYEVTIWFMALENPLTQQTAFISTMVGIAGVVIGLYQNSGTKWSDFTFRPWNDKIKPIMKKRLEESKPKDPILDIQDEDEFY